MVITKNVVVLLDCKIKEREKQGDDDNCCEFVYLHGGYKGILPTIEEKLHGKTEGDYLEIALTNCYFGEFDDDLVRVEDQSLFHEGITLGESFTLTGEEYCPLSSEPLGAATIASFLKEARNNDPNKIIYRITDIEGGKVVLDGNHPFAGIEPIVCLRIRNLRLASDDEIISGRVI